MVIDDTDAGLSLSLSLSLLPVRSCLGNPFVTKAVLGTLDSMRCEGAINHYGLNVDLQWPTYRRITSKRVWLVGEHCLRDRCRVVLAHVCGSWIRWRCRTQTAAHVPRDMRVDLPTLRPTAVHSGETRVWVILRSNDGRRSCHLAGLYVVLLFRSPRSPSGLQNTTGQRDQENQNKH